MGINIIEWPHFTSVQFMASEAIGKKEMLQKSRYIFIDIFIYYFLYPLKELKKQIFLAGLYQNNYF